MRLTAEIEGEGLLPGLPGDGAALVAFMSFAVSRGFGAQHPLIVLADLLHERGVKLGPLTTFYETTAEDQEDEQKLELSWQAAGPLRESLLKMADVLATDDDARTFARRGGVEGSLEDQARALADLLGDVAASGARVRLGYEL